MNNNSSLDSLPINSSTGGYACGLCGEWVLHGAYHACSQPQPTNAAFVPIALSVNSQRLAELMEAERKLKEIGRILKLK